MGVQLHFIAKALVLDEHDNCLVLRRSQTHPDMGLAPDLPGGNLESGERPQDAAVREIAEETGLHVAADKLALFYANTNFYNDISHTRFVFVARVAGDRPAVHTNPGEHARWV